MVAFAMSGADWRTAVILALGALLGALIAAIVTWITKRQEIRASDERQWDLHKYESVRSLMAQCDRIAEVVWNAETRDQTKRRERAKQEVVGLTLLHPALGRQADNLLAASVKRSKAADNYEREEADEEVAKASDALITQTRKDLHRGRRRT